jgi:transposase
MSIKTVKRISVIGGAQRSMTITDIDPEKSAIQGSVPPDPEVAEKTLRRRFTAEYKLSILHQADSCTEPDSLGALLRR